MCYGEAETGLGCDLPTTSTVLSLLQPWQCLAL